MIVPVRHRNGLLRSTRRHRRLFPGFATFDGEAGDLEEVRLCSSGGPACRARLSNVTDAIAGRNQPPPSRFPKGKGSGRRGSKWLAGALGYWVPVQVRVTRTRNGGSSARLGNPSDTTALLMNAPTPAQFTHSPLLKGADVAQEPDPLWFTDALLYQLHVRSEAHTSDLQSLLRISYAVVRFNKTRPHTQPRISTA